MIIIPIGCGQFSWSKIREISCFTRKPSILMLGNRQKKWLIIVIRTREEEKIREKNKTKSFLQVFFAAPDICIHELALKQLCITNTPKAGVYRTERYKSKSKKLD